jgi:hypothetical protein
MRTTLEVEDDVLQAAKEIARREGITMGKALSMLARKGLAAPAKGAGKRGLIRGGIPVFPSRGDVITVAHVRRLMEEEGV